ncbi:MAG: histidine kinase, partial [Acidimicrobiia bacterium]
MEGRANWQNRVRRVVLGAEWVALAVGTIASLYTLGGTSDAYAAVAVAALWVVTASSIPSSLLERPLVLDAFVLAGVILTMTALMLSGGPGSSFFLLTITPGIHAAVVGGYRPALAASALSGMLIIAIALAQSGSVVTAGGFALLYLFLAVTVAHIHRILRDMGRQAEEAEAIHSASERRLEVLESANTMLSRLADLTAAEDTTPPAIGRAVLDDLIARFPGSAGVAVLEGQTGSIVIARRGETQVDGFERTIPLEVGTRTVGWVRLLTRERIDDAVTEDLKLSLRPVALAFANATLLQDITRHAVKEERVRLARELHDEIGPALASLGLSLDMSVVQQVEDSNVTEHLQVLRDRVTRLVEDVRTSVADLRSQEGGSLVSYIEALAADLPDTPLIESLLDER